MDFSSGYFVQSNVREMLASDNASDIENSIHHQQSHLSRAVCIFLAITLIVAFIIGTIGNITVLGLYIR